MPSTVTEQLRRPIVVVAAAAVVALGAVAYVFITSERGTFFSTATVTMGPITQEVESRGSVKAAQEVDLSFETSGRIDSVPHDVGAHVAQGTLLATLSSADQTAQLEQAKATLAMQQAKLASLQAGATPQSLAAAQTAVSNAKAGVSTAQQGVVQASQDAYVKADDAIHNRVDQLFTNPRSSSPVFNVQLSDSQALVAIQSQRISIEGELSAWAAYEQQLSGGSALSDSPAVVSQVRTYINDTLDYLDLLSGGLTHAIPSGTYPLATIQSYQASVSTGRSNVSSSLSGLNASATALTNASSALQTAEAQLAVTSAGATASDLAAQKAQVDAAQAAVDYAAAQVGKTSIYAPFTGTISRNDAHVGGTASPGTPLISMISDSAFQLDSYVSEADLAKLQMGQQANVMLDAYPQDSFPAHVITIDPAATVQNGVTSYKVTLQFDSNDPRILSGLTGSVAITTSAKAAVLLVPSSAIIENASTTLVLKQERGAFVLTPVSIGISGGGKTEIVSGLQAGDTIRAF